MKKLKCFFYLIILIFLLKFITNCPNPTTKTGNGSGNSNQNKNTIDKITDDLELSDNETYTINEDIYNIKSSIYLRNKTKLIIKNCELFFFLNEDLEVGIYLYDESEIIIENSKIFSNEKMWEFELRNNSSINVKESYLENHSAVKLFDSTKLEGKNSFIEELRMDQQSSADIEGCEIYPNLQFFFSVSDPIVFPEPYTEVSYVFDYSEKNGWKLKMNNSEAQGWQVDVYPSTNLEINNSKDVNLGLRSDGNVNTTLDLTNPHGSTSDFILTDFGFTLNVVNTEVYFINLYLKGSDNVVINGEKVVGTYNTTLLEIVLLEDAKLTVNNSHIFAQLLHANDNTYFEASNCLIGSDDPADPIKSEFGIKDDATSLIKDSNFIKCDIVISDDSELTLDNCIQDGETEVIINNNGKLNVL